MKSLSLSISWLSLASMDDMELQDHCHAQKPGLESEPQARRANLAERRLGKCLLGSPNGAGSG